MENREQGTWGRGEAHLGFANRQRSNSGEKMGVTGFPRQVHSPCCGEFGEVLDLDSLRPGSVASEGTHHMVAS
uniref:Uncharacterized protein n=1 Tax=Aegilops tauschii subsp. strangulata TaxID=200361 RepID=A0A453I294_AEGTS